MIMKSLKKLLVLAFALPLLTSCGGSSDNNTYWTVTFMSDSSVYTTIEVANGEAVERPEDPTKEDYTFTNWYEDEPLTIVFDFSTEITSDWTLYAGWTVSGSSTSEGGSDSETTESESESEDTSSSAYTYTCTDLPTWITDDGCVVFAWVWSTNDTGSWHESSYTDDTTLEFGVDEELTGFVLARCIGGTTTPDWEETDDVAGRVYNQTSNVTCTSGVYTYSCPEDIWTK